MSLPGFSGQSMNPPNKSGDDGLLGIGFWKLDIGEFSDSIWFLIPNL